MKMVMVAFQGVVFRPTAVEEEVVVGVAPPPAA